MDVYVYDPTSADELSRVRGIGRYLQILREYFKDWKYIANPDQVPQNSVFINPFLNFLQPPLKNTSAQKRIAVIHDLIPLKYPNHFPVGLHGKLNIFLNKMSLKNYDLIVTDSHASKKDIMKLLGIPGEKIKVIYPPVSDIFSKKIKNSFQTPNKYCLYVGDATWNKNLVNLAKAVKEINVTCVFVGKIFKTTDSLNHPWQKELKQFLLDTKDDKRFVFPGFVSDEELINLYKNAQCNILVSRDEGFGFSFVEAAILSTPSVLADIDVLRETAESAALFARPDDHVMIANQIGEFYFNDNVKKLYGTRAKYRSDFFSKEKFKKEFEKLI